MERPHFAKATPSKELLFGVSPIRLTKLRKRSEEERNCSFSKVEDYCYVLTSRNWLFNAAGRNKLACMLQR